jgi:hypothetical protein
MRPTMSTVRDVRANESSDRGIPRRSRMKSLATHRLDWSAQHREPINGPPCTKALLAPLLAKQKIVRIIETRKVKKMKGKCVNLTPPVEGLGEEPSMPLSGTGPSLGPDPGLVMPCSASSEGCGGLAILLCNFT